MTTRLKSIRRLAVAASLTLIPAAAIVAASASISPAPAVAGSSWN